LFFHIAIQFEKLPFDLGGHIPLVR